MGNSTRNNSIITQPILPELYIINFSANHLATSRTYCRPLDIPLPTAYTPTPQNITRCITQLSSKTPCTLPT